MANNANKNVQKKPGAFNMYMHPHRYKFMRGLRKFLGTVTLLIFIFFLLSGLINQRKTGKTIVNYSIDKGRYIGSFFHSLVTNEGKLKITKDGIYFRDATVPDKGALDEILPDKETDKSSNTNK